MCHILLRVGQIVGYHFHLQQDTYQKYCPQHQMTFNEFGKRHYSENVLPEFQMRRHKFFKLCTKQQ